jgi:hypothetical protein
VSKWSRSENDSTSLLVMCWKKLSPFFGLFTKYDPNFANGNGFISHSNTYGRVTARMILNSKVIGPVKMWLIRIYAVVVLTSEP